MREKQEGILWDVRLVLYPMCSGYKNVCVCQNSYQKECIIERVNCAVCKFKILTD